MAKFVESDEHVTLAQQTQNDIGGPIILINRFSVNPEDADQFIKTCTIVYDAVLVTHSHNDHIKDLPLITAKYSEQKSGTLKVYCTKECREQLSNKFPDLASKTNGSSSGVSFNVIRHRESFNVGPISVTPIS